MLHGMKTYEESERKLFEWSLLDEGEQSVSRCSRFTFRIPLQRKLGRS